MYRNKCKYSSDRISYSDGSVVDIFDKKNVSKLFNTYTLELYLFENICFFFLVLRKVNNSKSCAYCMKHEQ